MNRITEFRRLRWLLHVQDLIHQEKQYLMISRLSTLNVEETALEFNRNELERLLDAEVNITRLSYTYDFTHEPSQAEIAQYVSDVLGIQINTKKLWQTFQ